MRICYLGWGDHVHMERWAGYFAHLGHEVIILSLSGRGSYQKEVRQYRLSRFAWSYRAQIAWLRLLLRHLKPDWVHVHWANFAGILDGIWDGPLAVTVWGSEIYKLAEMSPITRERLVRALNQAAVVTCDSQDLAARIETLATLPKGQVAIIQWGVDMERFRPEGQAPSIFNLDGGTAGPVILSPRAFTPLYNLHIIIDAFALVHEKIPDVRLLMKRYAAKPDYERQVLARIEELGLTAVVGIVGEIAYEAMADFYRAGQVLVSVPDSDGTPMSLLEGMACGCIPVVSDLPSLREWVTHGTNGWLVPVRDTQVLADTLLDALSDSERISAWGARNIKLVQERASQDVNMRRMQAIMEARMENTGRCSEVEAQQPNP